MISSNTYALSANKSGLIPNDGTTSAILDLGNKIFDEWSLVFYMYIPSNKEAHLNIQGEVPIDNGEWVIGNIHFNKSLQNPGIGLIDNSALGAVNFEFPHDQWFFVGFNFDLSSGISSATFEMYVFGEEVIPAGTSFTDGIATIPTSLGGINFFSSNENNEYYIDEVYFFDEFIDLEIITVILNIDEFTSKSFSATPNPVQNNLQLNANETITSIRITNMLGQVVHSQPIQALEASIDLSKLSKGTYFVHAVIGDTSGTVKIIK